MRTFAYVAGLLLCSTPAFAQVSISVSAPPPPRVVVHAPAPPPPPRVVVAPPPPPRVVVHAPPPAPPPRVVVQAPPPPVVRFVAPPPLVTVEPGIQVVENNDEEVFFAHGWYWHPGPDGTWWRTRNYRGGWAVAPVRVVPPALVHYPRGHYRHWHAEARVERREARAERRGNQWGGKHHR